MRGKPRLRRLLSPFLLGTGLFTSLLLTWQYLGSDALFGEIASCQIDGCIAARTSQFSSIAFVPTPILGVLYFAAVAWLWTIQHRLLLWVTGAGALAALGFLGVQYWVLESFCPWCVVVDACAILLFTSLQLCEKDRPSTRNWAFAAGLPGFVVFGVALLASHKPQSDLASIASPSKTIIEYVDFQCPYCRKLHTLLSELLRDNPTILVERRHLPLPNHKHAEMAARAACCAEEQGAGDLMADQLFQSREPNQTTCLEIANELKLSITEYSECLQSEATNKRLRNDRMLAEESQITALPTLIVGTDKFVGIPSRSKLEASILTLAGSPTSIAPSSSRTSTEL